MEAERRWEGGRGEGREEARGERGEGRGGGMGCEELLAEMVMSCEHLGKLNSLKRDGLYQEYSISADLQRLLVMLY